MKELQPAGREIPGRLERILQKYKDQEGVLIPVLQEIQSYYGYISRQHMAIVARALGLPASAVFGVASFYAQFYLEPRGEHMIRVCQGTACHVRSGGKVLEAFAAELGIRPGETTPDGKFSLESVACLGACGLAPAAVIGEKTYGRLTPGKVKEVLESYRD
ncbi:MAG: NADH-quinone oxidoreductase subunit NuoE [Peptococcaceae bacterium]|jgi:NADH-quinone oxidoreductase subunit E|nr:NADH-quinone oxidoreductase subunit NuoE [Peptococcaceae bacterium]MDH7524495.1 NADH-quinone oxidoreductase subunit NuoE [Peptococcaceae bacterium]